MAISTKSRKQPQTSTTAKLGAFFKKKRLEDGVSLQAVADYLGTSISEVEQYEAGTKAIPLNRIYAISNCLNASPEEVTHLLNFG